MSRHEFERGEPVFEGIRQDLEDLDELLEAETRAAEISAAQGTRPEAEVRVADCVHTARTLRWLKSGWDDERIKRWLLSTLGWRFSRRSGLWEHPTDKSRKLSPEHGLTVAVYVAGAAQVT